MERWGSEEQGQRSSCRTLWTAILVVERTKSRLLDSTLGQGWVLSGPMMRRLSSVDWASSEQQCDVGIVTLTLDTTEDREGVVMARLVVSDSGYGISQEDQRQVFRRFFRSADATERAVQGTGLGLSIVQAIVEGHEGTISVESTLGVGSTFTVLLPLSTVAAQRTRTG